MSFYCLRIKLIFLLCDIFLIIIVSNTMFEVIFFKNHGTASENIKFKIIG